MALKILIIGALPPPIGGATVSLQALIEALAVHSIQVSVVDCAVRSRPFGKLRTLAKALMQTLRLGARVDVITCHMSDRGAVVAAPFFWMIARLLGKPFVYRQFGGELHDTYWKLNRVARWWVRATTLRSDVVLLQTRQLIDSLRSECKFAVVWFPTARHRGGDRYEGRFARAMTKPLRCVFVGHLRKAKGICEAIAAVRKVPDAELHVYGPLLDIRVEDLSAPRVSYHGALDPTDVQSHLASADVLLFPTYHPGEGYPGTLVEAALVGVPVVASRWQALPEMFPNDELIWVRPHSVEDLVSALDDILAGRTDLSAASRKLLSRGAEFEAERIFERFATVCRQLASTGRYVESVA